MNGVSRPQCLPCITGALASGRTPGSAGKQARNARNGPADDKKKIPRSRPDLNQQAPGQSPGRNERDDDKEWDGKGCRASHRSRVDTKTINTVALEAVRRDVDGKATHEKRKERYGVGRVRSDYTGDDGHGERSQ